MDTTRLSSKGQIIIPKDVRTRRQWKAGQEFALVETEEGVLLRPVPAFRPTRIEDVGRALNYSGPAVPVEQLSIEGLTYADRYDEEEDDRS